MRIKGLLLSLMLMLQSAGWLNCSAQDPPSGLPLTSDVVLNPYSVGAFGRIRVSDPQNLLDVQFTYDLQPLVYDTITVGSGTYVKHDSINRMAIIGMDNSPPGSTVGMQTFDFYRNQPGKSQHIFITFNFRGGSVGATKSVGYSDGENGVELIMDDTIPKLRILSGTGSGNVTIPQSDWNVDPLNGDGPSKKKIDFTKTQILVIDLQALYVGKVRVGFDFDGRFYFAHIFYHANENTFPYLQTSNLPIRAYMTNDAMVTDSMNFICASVMSEGGFEEDFAIAGSTEESTTVANGSDSHILSIQPKLTFNGKVNRSKIAVVSINIFNMDDSDVMYKVVMGQDITGGTTSDVSSYSAIESVTGGTLVGTPDIILYQGYVPGAQGISNNEVSETQLDLRLPITLDHEGKHRDLGRVSVIGQGLNGAADVRASLMWKEIR